MSEHFKDKYILITGAAGVLGAAVAQALDKKGAHLILLDHDLPRLEHLDDQLHSTTLVPCDLQAFEQLDRLAFGLAERFARLDGWVSCAVAFMALQPLLQIPLSQWQKEFAVNVTAHLKLLQVLMPLLVRSSAGRVVWPVDTSQLVPQAYWGGFALSQHVIMHMVQLYVEENPLTSVYINLFDPGPFASPLQAKAFPGKHPALYPAVADIANALITLLEEDCQTNGKVYKFREMPRI